MIETRGLNKLSTESIIDFREYLCILCRYYTDGRNIKKSELQPTKLEYLVSISLLRRWQDRFCTVEVQARICKIDSASLQNRACRFGIEFPPCKIGPATGVRLWRSTRYMSIYRVDTRLQRMSAILTCGECLRYLTLQNVYQVDMKLTLQGGEDLQDALSCRSFSAKEPLISGLFCGK